VTAVLHRLPVVAGDFGRVRSALLAVGLERVVGRAALLSSLQAALQVPKEQLWQTAGCTAGDETCFDAVRFRPIGAITVPELPWINRPTYQQVVQVNGHRPR